MARANASLGLRTTSRLRDDSSIGEDTMTAVARDSFMRARQAASAARVTSPSDADSNGLARAISASGSPIKSALINSASSASFGIRVALQRLEVKVSHTTR